MLTDIQKKAAEYVAFGYKVGDIARKLDVPRSTLYSWRKNGEFLSTVEAYVECCKMNGQNRITRRLEVYIDELENIALHARSDKTRLDALQYLIDRCLGKPANINQNTVKKVEKTEEKKELCWNDLEKEGIKLKMIK